MCEYILPSKKNWNIVNDRKLDLIFVIIDIQQICKPEGSSYGDNYMLIIEKSLMLKGKNYSIYHV